MVVLNECRIDQEGKHLVIEAQVENLSYYKDVYIESVIIDTDKTYSPNGPSYNPVFKKDYESEPYKVDVRTDCNSIKVDKDCKCGDIYTAKKAGVKHIHLILNARDLSGVGNFNDNIFFIYIKATGTPAPHTPCGRDNEYTMGVAVNLRPIYNMAMNYIKELDIDCTPPKGFIDMILRLKAFDLSLRTGNYTMAFKQWDRLFKNKKNIPSRKGCGCNG